MAVMRERSLPFVSAVVAFGVMYFTVKSPEECLAIIDIDV
jgi:hypothetical protein